MASTVPGCCTTTELLKQLVTHDVCDVQHPILCQARHNTEQRDLSALLSSLAEMSDAGGCEPRDARSLQFLIHTAAFQIMDTLLRIAGPRLTVCLGCPKGFAVIAGRVETAHLLLAGRKHIAGIPNSLFTRLELLR